MTDIVGTWKEALPKIQNSVSGRGVWAALNAARPIAYEDNVFVLGVPHEDSELSGHLRIPATKRVMEMMVSQVLGSNVSVRIIDGVTQEDYGLMKRRDAERRRLEEHEMTKMRAEMSAKTSWDTIYEQLSRRFAAVANKSLPQSRARFYEEAIEIIAQARRDQTTFDDMGERNFARCLERLAQYVEIPSAMVAHDILKRAEEL
jgi:hypothetical protein